MNIEGIKKWISLISKDARATHIYKRIKLKHLKLNYRKLMQALFNSEII